MDEVSGCLLVDIHKAQGLLNVAMFAENEPFVRASISTSMRPSISSPVAIKGGTDPEWQDARLCLDTTGCVGEVSVLLEIFDSGIMNDTLIGKVDLWLDSSLKMGEKSWFLVDTGGKLECTLSGLKGTNMFAGTNNPNNKTTNTGT